MKIENRLTKLFSRKKRDFLSIYLTAGFPSLHDTLPLLETIQESGVDFVELGFPYSDPLADGKVIQHSSEVALKNGMSLDTLFSQLEHFREKVEIPVLLMGYLNPVLRFGVEKFAARAAEVGIDGTIIPDLPFEYYKRHVRKEFAKNNLSHIFLVTPQTTAERITEFASEGGPFIYAVSGFGVTGQAPQLNQSGNYPANLRARTDLPIVSGFGIKTRADTQRALEISDGAVIGSAFVSAIKDATKPVVAAREFIESVRG